MTKPNREQAESAFSIIDRAVSQLDCKGLTVVQVRDLIAAMQIMGQFVAADAPAQAVEADRA